MVCVVIHVHVRIKERVSSEIRVWGSGKAVLCSLIFKGLCPRVKTEIQQRRVGFAAFAALLGLIDGVVIITVPLWPEFPSYPLAVHGEVDQLTCSVARTARVSSQRQHPAHHLAFSGIWKNGAGQTLKMSTEELLKSLDFLHIMRKVNGKS